MRRIVNMRMMLLVAVSEIVLVLILYLTSVSLGAGIVLRILYYAVLIAMGVVSYKTSRKKLLAALVFCLTFAVVTNITYDIRLHTFHSVSVEQGGVYEINGTIDTMSDKNGRIRYVTLSGGKINGNFSRGKIRVVFENDDIPFDTFALGDGVSVTGKLYAIKLIDENKVNGATYRKNVRYTLYASFDDCRITDTNPGLLLRIRAALYKKLRFACGETYGSVAYCMLTGDKSELDTDISRMFGIVGIGHVLAVSGLHVGIFAGSLLFLLRKLKVNKIAQFSIVTAILVLYCLFVGMTASVIRASLMSILAMGVLLHGQRKDTLSALCFAFSVTLAAEPFLLFEVGFLMSYCSVFGLIVFSVPICNTMRRIHIPKWIAMPLSATVSISVATVPVSAYFFGAVQTYSFLFNLLLLPLISLTFIGFLISAPVSFLFHTDIPLRICGMGFAVTDMITGIASYLPFASVYVKSHVTLFLLYPLFFVISRFFILPKGKRIVSLLIGLMCVTVVIVPTLATLNPPEKIGYSVIPVNGYSDVTSVIVDDGVTVLGDVKDVPALSRVLKKYGIRKVNAIILHRLTQSIGENLADFVYDFQVNRIVCSIDTMESDGLAALGNYKSVYLWEENPVEKVSRVLRGDKHCGYTYSFSEENILLSVGYSVRYTDIPQEVLTSVTLIRCFMYLNDSSTLTYLTNMPKGYLGMIPSRQFSLADNGEFIYKVFSGEILS